MSEMETIVKIMEIFARLTDEQKEIAIEWAAGMAAENAKGAGNDYKI